MDITNFQITYLFGAGASCGALPIVDKIPTALNEFLNWFNGLNINLSSSEMYEQLDRGSTKREIQKDFINTIIWMKKEAGNHASIDTFAKKLYVTRQFDLLVKLKAGLSCYFILEQIKKPSDIRYDSFFAALIDAEKLNDNLPSHLKIISWNYDFQFEKAYSAYSLQKGLDANQIMLNVYPSKRNNLTKNKFNLPDKFSIFKLNGTTSFEDASSDEILNLTNEVDFEINPNSIDNIIKAYAGLTKSSYQYKSLITFAWEDNKVAENVVEQAKNATENTEVLVVIGYSFPFFNREIDRKIIRNMSKLKKVYFQAPNNEPQKYIDRFRSIIKDMKNIETEQISDVKQFFLPPEL